MRDGADTWVLPATRATSGILQAQLNREAWLTQLKTMMHPWFAEQRLVLPDAAVTCGWPSRGGTSRSQRVIGQCWNAAASTRRQPEIFISPAIDESLEVAHVLLHELLHAALPTAGHGPVFRRHALALGLEGQMRATVPSSHLIRRLEPLLAQLGPYPHGRIRLDPLARPQATPKAPRSCPGDERTQTTRMLKVYCPSCGYLVRGTARWLRVAIPVCPNARCARHGATMTWTGEGAIVVPLTGC